MAQRTREELLKFIIATEGDDEIRSLVKELDKLGQTSGESADKANELLKEIESLAETSAAISKFTKLKATVKELGEQFTLANRRVSELELQLARDPGNAGLGRQLEKARASASALQRQQNSTNAEFQRTSGILARAGIGMGNLSASARDLESKMGGAKAQARALAQATRESASAAGSGVSNFSKLSGVLGTLAGFLSLRTAVQGIKSILGLGDAAEKTRIQLASLYGGTREGNQAFDRIKALAKETGQNFEELIKSAAKLKAFGLEPLDGTMKALINQNAKLGGSNETLQGIILAVGQAWAKQKLQGEEILQLVERGVPVWELLSKATGKNVLELQKLSEQGKLGRDVIKQLLDEIERSSDGAASKGLNTLSGIVVGLTQDVKDFFNQVADAGVLDFFKQKIKEFRAEVGALASSGELQKYAKNTADAIIGLSKILIGLTKFVVQHARQIAVLAGVYASLRIAGLANQFLAMAAAMRANAAATSLMTTAAAAQGAGLGRLSTLITNFPKVLKVGIVIAAAESLVTTYENLQKIQAVREEMAKNEAQPEILRMELLRDQLRLGQELQGLYAQYAGQLILDAEKLRSLTQAQAEDYKYGLQQARAFFGGIIREARATGDAQKEALATQRWKELGVAVDEVRVKIRQLGAATAEEVAKTAIADAAVIKYDEMIAKATQASEAVKGIFSGLDLSSEQGVLNASEIITQMAARGSEAARVVREELAVALDKVSNEKLPALKAAALDALNAGVTGAKEFADEVNKINLTRLGVDVQAIKTGFTEAGGAAVIAFRGAIKEVDALKLTAEQSSAAIAQAFASAFAKASTSNELKALKQSLQDALSAGNIGFAEFQTSVAAVDQKLAGLAATGTGATQQITAGATQASAAISAIGDSADYAAQETQILADTSQQVAAQINETTKAQDGFTASLGEGSALFHQINQEANRFANSYQQDFWRQAINGNFNMRNEQRKALDEVSNAIKKQNLQYDETEQKLVGLRKEFTLLTDAELIGLIQQQDMLEKNIQKEQELAEQKKNKNRTPVSSVSGPSAGSQSAPRATSSAAEKVIVIRFEVGDDSAELYHFGDDQGLRRTLEGLNAARIVSVKR